MEAPLKRFVFFCSLFLIQFTFAQTVNTQAGKIEEKNKLTSNSALAIKSIDPVLGTFKTNSLENEMIPSERNLDDLTNPNLEVFTGLHQTFYLAALFLGVFALFYFQLKSIHFLVALILGFISTYTYPLDKYVHELFVHTHFYRILGAASFENNDQYGKLFIYALLIIALFILLFLRKKPKLFSLITLLLLFVNLLVVAINHFSLPNGFYKDVLNDRKELLLSINAKTKDARLSSCTEFRIVCLDISDIQELDAHTIPIESVGKEEIKSYLIRSFVTQGAFAAIRRSNNPSILAVLKINKRIFLAYDVEYPLIQWRRAEGYFSRASFFVSLGWYFFALVLCLIHATPARRYAVNYFRRGT